MGRRDEGDRTVKEICVFAPNTVRDEREIGDTLLSGRTVILSLENFSFADSQRILDFSAGVCCAIDGEMAKISDNVFIIGPEGVDINGDLVGGHDKENDISISEIDRPEIIDFVKQNRKRVDAGKR